MKVKRESKERRMEKRGKEKRRVEGRRREERRTHNGEGRRRLGRENQRAFFYTPQERASSKGSSNLNFRLEYLPNNVS